jgi:hypothetical protein
MIIMYKKYERGEWACGVVLICSYFLVYLKMLYIKTNITAYFYNFKFRTHNFS